MKVEVGPDGLVVSAGDLGPLLGLAPEEVPEAMRRGEVTSLHEEGRGEDAGRFRITFRHGRTRLRLTCGPDGTVLKRSRWTAGR